MNFVYEMGKLTPLTPSQLADAANLVNPFGAYTEMDFMGSDDRTQNIMCQCKGSAEFELLPPKDGEYRRYVRCRICGEIKPL